MISKSFKNKDENETNNLNKVDKEVKKLMVLTEQQI